MTRMNHIFVRIAERVERDRVVGNYRLCEACGMVVIEDHRGTLLVGANGFGGIHKRIFPGQRTPGCMAMVARADVHRELDRIRAQFAAKHDPRFRVLEARAI
jgi:hypothetical protein